MENLTRDGKEISWRQFNSLANNYGNLGLGSNGNGDK